MNKYNAILDVTIFVLLWGWIGWRRWKTGKWIWDE